MQKPKIVPFRFPAPVADEMIRAAMDGRKTVMRCPVKFRKWEITGVPQWATRRGPEFWFEVLARGEDPGPKTVTCISIKPPYRPGDILCVQEKWCKTDCFGLQNGYVYEANDNSIFEHTGFTPQWRPATQMPQEAARLYLRIMDLWVERLQDVTPNQAMKEGVLTKENRPYLQYEQVGQLEKYVRAKMFPEVWDRPMRPADLALYG